MIALCQVGEGVVSQLRPDRFVSAHEPGHRRKDVAFEGEQINHSRVEGGKRDVPAIGFFRSSHAASVTTGQHVKSGGESDSSVSTHSR